MKRYYSDLIADIVLLLVNLGCAILLIKYVLLEGAHIMDWASIAVLFGIALGLISAIILVVRDILTSKRGMEALSKEHSSLSKEHSVLSKEHDAIKHLLEKGHETLAAREDDLKNRVIAVDKDVALLRNDIQFEQKRRQEKNQVGTDHMKAVQQSLDTLSALNNLLKETNLKYVKAKAENEDLREQLEDALEANKAKSIQIKELRAKISPRKNDYDFGPEQ